jgi:hypothetical protein
VLVLVLFVPQIPNPCVSAFSAAICIARCNTTMPAFLPPFRLALNIVSCSVVTGTHEGSRAMPLVVTLMMPWLLPRSCAYIMTSRSTCVSASS